MLLFGIVRFQGYERTFVHLGMAIGIGQPLVREQLMDDTMVYRLSVPAEFTAEDRRVMYEAINALCDDPLQSLESSSGAAGAPRIPMIPPTGRWLSSNRPPRRVRY